MRIPAKAEGIVQRADSDTARAWEANACVLLPVILTVEAYEHVTRGEPRVASRFCVKS